LKYDKINGAFNVDAYRKMYNGSVRKTGDRRCIKTNMLDQAYLILAEAEAEANDTEWIGPTTAGRSKKQRKRTSRKTRRR
jgi:hypothetical protein